MSLDNQRVVQIITLFDELGLVDAADVLRKYQTAACNYSRFPQSHRRKFCSTNGVERINAEIKRRIKIMRAFPNDESAMRLIVAIIIDVDEDFLAKRFLHPKFTMVFSSVGDYN